MTTPIRDFRKKPVEIQAVQFLDASFSAGFIAGWLGGKALLVDAGKEHRLRKKHEFDRSNGHCYPENAPAFLVIHTFTGPQRADRGDWIIKDAAGGFYPLDKLTFAATYEEVVVTP